MDSEDHNLELQFEDGDLSLWEVLKTYPLPVVVQCDTAHCPIPMDRSRFNFDLSQPLLLYRKRTIQKVTAKNLHIDPKNGSFQDSGDTLLIPEDYKGWFSVLKRNFHNGPIDDLVPHFQEVSEIADSPTETFLIGGDKKVQALQVSTKENGHLVHQQRTLFPGDVLRKGKLYIGEKKRKSKILRKTKVVTEKYLMCTDDSDREILLPFGQKGLFYTLTSNSGNILRPVMQMSQIVAKKYPPCIARLVYGRIPNTPCSFSGTLRLDRSDLEQSVIAATIVNKRNILLELPTTCNLKFKVAVTNDDLIQNAGYRNSLEICNEKATIYMRHMKVCHTIEPDSHCVEIKFNPKVAEKTESDVNMTDDGATKHGGDPQSEFVTFKRDSSLYESNRVSFTDDGISSKTSSGSDYFEMRTIKGESICESVVRDSVNSVDTASSRSSSDYADMGKLPLPSLLKIGVENSFLTVSVSERNSRALHESDPPNVPPPPPPTEFVQNNESVNSGVSDRRPSTVTFCEGKHFFEDNPMYDIPRRTRRDSAPPELGFKSEPNPSIQMKQEFLRRPSSAMPLPKCSTLPSRMRDCVQEPLHEHHELDVDWSQDEADMIPEYNSDEEFGTPDYENLVGMVKVHEDFTTTGSNRKMDVLPALPVQNPHRSSSGKSLSCESGQMTPQKVAEMLVPKDLVSSIGPIPDLPRSRNSPRTSSLEPELDQVFINTESSLLDIPALPVSKSRSTSPCIESNDNSPHNSSTPSNSKQGCLDENANSTTDISPEELQIDMDLAHKETTNYTEELETEQCNEDNIDVEEDEGDDEECSQSDSNEVEDDDDYQNIAKFGGLEVSHESTMSNKNELDDVISSEHDFGCIPEGLIHRGSSDRYSLHSDKSIATTSMDSGIVSRDPSVFGSKNSDLQMRNSQELESYDNWKAAGFTSSHIEGRDTPSDIVVGSPAGASFEINDSFSDGSFSHDQSLESEHIGSPPGKEVRHVTPIRKSNLRRTKSRESKDISKMSTEDLTKEFRRLGIKPETLQSIKDENLNGLDLLEKYASIETVQELFPKAGLIEQQKISLYIKGCKY